MILIFFVSPLPSARPPPQPTAPLPPALAWNHYRGSSLCQGARAEELPASLELRWSFATGEAISSSPVCDGERVYFGSDNGNLYALDYRNGRQVWMLKGTDAVEAPPCLAEGRLYVGTSGG
ncbi:MAG: PQQ-binding-like beta-propeller repeat protein, partial [Planctomycetes bacterium]|nr:PQQ-binding-like beta-propeller repeat protein [Planctomycetota bacterium]